MKFNQIIGILSIGFVFAFTSTKVNGQKILAMNHDNTIVQEKIKKYFEDCSVDGSVALYDNNNQKWIVSDRIQVYKEALPASTFKIINLLIALETKIISDENEVVSWVGSTDTVKYGFRPDIYHDMTVKEAFEVSAGWVFIELSKKIGRNNYMKYLKECNYGNLDLSQPDHDFWNFGNFAISPVSQVLFIKNLYDGKLPFSKRNMEIVKRVMIAEQNEKYTIRAKTGWTRDKNINTGWWVGYIEDNDQTYFFATQLLQDRITNRGDFGSCRKDITKKIFIDLGVIK